jgi:transposase InsO family protein
MLLPTEFLQCQSAIGQDFTLDGAALDDGSNSQCTNFCSPSHPFEKAAIRGHTVFLNGPFDDTLAVMMEHYCREKTEDPYHTSGCFVVPRWKGVPWQRYLTGMQVLKRYPKGSRIFTSVNAHTGERELMPGIPWEVLVYWDPPKRRPAPRVRLNLVAALNQVAVSTAVQMEVEGKLAGAPCTFLLDSGSKDMSFISQSFAQRLNLKTKPASSIQVVAYDGSEFPSTRTATVWLQLGNVREKITLPVVKMEPTMDVILGCDWLTSHGVHLYFDKAQISLKNGRRRITLPAKRAPLPTTEDLCPSSGRAQIRATTTRSNVLRVQKAKRLLRKNVFSFMVTVRRLPANASELTPVSPTSAPGGCVPACSSGDDEREFNVNRHNSSRQEDSPTTEHDFEFDVSDLVDKPDLSSVSGQGSMSQSDIDDLVSEFADILREPPPGLPRWRDTIPTIPTTEGAKPPYRAPFRLSPAERRELEKQIEHLLQMGYIQPSTSPYGAPILFVPKHDGTLRMCVDYRMLNSITVKNRHPVPRIDDLLDTLSGAQVFSSIDLAAGYWQIRLKEDEVPKTAFSTHLGHFEWRVLPMGLSNAVATFQNLMNKMFMSRGYLNKFVLVYLDDILVFSKNPADHARHLRLVLQALREEELYAKPSKCHFNKSELKYLGHVVSAEGISVDPSKAQAVQQFPRPQNVGDTRSFLGLATYFRRFIQGFGVLARPLNALTRKACTRTGWHWTPECEASFMALKEALSSAPVLAMPDWPAAETGAKPFEVIADASVHGIGAVLMQDGHAIAYESKKFHPAAYNYDTGEQELFAIVYALQKFRCYVEGTEFKLVSDHEPLTFLDKQPRLSRKQARWYEFLRPFSYTWEHRPGRVNVADPLSRAPGVRSFVEHKLPKSNSVVLGPRHSRFLLTAILRARPSRRDPDQTSVPATAPPRSQRFSSLEKVLHTQSEGCANVEQRLTPLHGDSRVAPPEEPSGEQLPPPPLEGLVARSYSEDPDFSPDNIEAWGLVQEDELLWHGGSEDSDAVLAIPNANGLRRRCLELCHDSPYGGHFGVAKTLHLMQRSFWWPSMKQDVESHVRGCLQCQQSKPSHLAPAGELSPMPVPKERWESVALDFIVKLPVTNKGNDAILVIVDRLSKYVILEACSETMTSSGLIECLQHRLIRDKGFPKEIVADRDGRLSANKFSTWAKENGILPRLSTSYHSRASGQVERFNLIVENYLRSFVGAQYSEWDELIPVCQLAINNSYHSTVEHTPFFLEHGKHPYLPGITTFKRASVSPAQIPVVRHQWPTRQRKALSHAQQAMKTATERAKRHFDLRKRALELSPGDRVLLNTKNLTFKGITSSKLAPRFVGPFTVEEKVGNVCYKLALPETMEVYPVFHVELLRLYKGPDFIPPPAVECEDGSVQYTIDKILKSRGTGSKRQYLVRWEGYDPTWDSWEPRELLLEDAPETLLAYEATQERLSSAEPVRTTGRRRHRKRKA